ncbi:MAG: hypothetical protein ACJ739_02355, partial [Acidimicrobiales bacterium]
MAPSTGSLVRASPAGGPPGREEHRPERAPGLQLIGPMQGSGHRSRPFLVRRSDGQTIQLTEVLFATLCAIDGHRAVDAVAREVSRAVQRQATAEQVELLLEDRLRPLGLVREADGSVRPVTRANPLLALRFRWVVSRPDLTRRLTAPFVWLFRPLTVLVTVIAFALSTGWVLFDNGLAAPAHHAFNTPGLLLGLLCLTLASAAFHELGHAAACQYGGATPGAMGAGLYLLWPAFYTDVTDSYRLSRAGRLRVDLGGLYFNAVFGVAVFAVWWVTGADALLLVLPIQVLQMLRQLTPFVRADGYHIIADLVGVPDLFAHIKPTLCGFLPTRWGRADSRRLKWWARLVILAWVVAVVPLLIVSMVMAVLFLPRLVASATISIRGEWYQLTEQLGTAQLLGAMVSVVSLVASALPVFAVVYLIGRVTSRTARRVLRATDGRPLLRGIAAALAAALFLFVGWAWWPHGQYEPLGGEEEGTVQETLSLHLSKPRHDATPAAVGGIPSSSDPEPAMVLVPRRSDGAPALVITGPTGGGEPLVRTIPPDEDGGWPFPFPAPPAPAEGDNRALAVNTADGTAVYDVAFSLVWVVDDDVGHRNDAWALASCKHCRSVAVAFQTILVVGRAEVVKPVNAAVSVNFECELCDSSAIAVQLVATLSSMPSADVVAQIEAIWHRVEGLEHLVQGLDAPEIYLLVNGFEAEILEVLLTSGPVDSTSSVAADDGTPAPTTSTPPTAPTPTSDTMPAEPAPTEPPPAEVTTTTAPPDPTTTTTEPADTTTTAP